MVLGDIAEYRDERFNSVFIFEVLEHIHDDRAIIDRLFSLTNPEGLLMLSVPAKQSLYGVEDAFHGHVRRYERAELRGKLEESGFEIREFWCYNPIPYVMKYLLPDQVGNPKEDLDEARRTRESAYELHPSKERLVKLLYPIYSRMQFLLKFQNAFLNTDFGAHYLVVAQRPSR
jgi:hypothetical protein